MERETTPLLIANNKRPFGSVLKQISGPMTL